MDKQDYLEYAKRGWDLTGRIGSAGTDASEISKLLEDVEAFIQEVPASQGDGFDLRQDVLRHVVGRPRVCALALARWLTADETWGLGKEIARQLEVHSMNAESVAPVDLSGVPFPQAVLCTLRLCAEAAHPVITLAWTCAISVSGYRPVAQVRTVVNALMYHHALEFPATSLRLLRRLPESYARIKVAREHLRMLERECKELDSHKRATELDMTESMRLAVADYWRRQNQEILDGGRKRSVLADLFHTEYLKYSYESAVEIHHAVGRSSEQTVAMAPFSISYELPLSETLDPQGGQLRRDRMYKGTL